MERQRVWVIEYRRRDSDDSWLPCEGIGFNKHHGKALVRVDDLNEQNGYSEYRAVAYIREEASDGK